jgi:hypothetical protein
VAQDFLPGRFGERGETFKQGAVLGLAYHRRIPRGSAFRDE